ncbi:hypothetical protein PV797_17930 [Clostridiaceae bacterium M8S5]|nr:hypothetical protein PV797_17930 [Clostridiaceae bacterium M8S5]
MNKKVYVVNHTHWDREWQKTFHEYRCRLIGFMDKVIEVLNSREEFTSFMLDGQTSLLIDYLEIKPDMYLELRELVTSGKLIIGPWYVQPDEFIPSGESLLRNLLLGEIISKKFGQKMNIGYLPDSFGQSKNMPQILNAFGIESAVAMRGFYNKEINANEFRWKGTAKSEVLMSALWAGYNNGSQLSEELEEAKRFIDLNFEYLDKGATDNRYLFLAGSDQANIKVNMPEAIDNLNAEYKDVEFKISKLEEYIDEVSKHKDTLPVYQGDLRKGQMQRVHISIAGTRTDIKQKNYDIQTKIEKRLEPMSVMGYTLGDRYEKELIQKMWRLYIQNHAHDSICCVCTDEAHKDMINRIFEADEMYKALMKSRINNFAEKIQFKKDKSRPIVVFNYNSFKTKQVVTSVVDVYDDFGLYTSDGEKIPYEIIEEEKINLKEYRLWLKENPDDFVTRKKISFIAEVEGVGFKTYYIKEGEIQQLLDNTFVVKEDSISNGLVTVKVESDSSITIHDQVSNKCMQRTFNIVESGNTGDEYDYSPPINDIEYNSKTFEKKVNIKVINNYEAFIEVTNEMLVNKDTNSNGRSDELVTNKVTRVFKLTRDSRLVELDVKVDNVSHNHRVSLEVADFSNQYHIAESSFGDDKRLNRYENVPEDTQAKWKEYYYPIYSTQRYVYGENIAVFNRGIPSYEIKKGKDLYIHMLTTMDYMGKENLLYRGGRRSGAKIKTKDSLMIGQNNFEFAILLTEDKDVVSKYADEFQNSLTTHYIHKPNSLGLVSDDQVFFKIEEDRIATSALLSNQLENTDGIIWRVKNMSDESVKSIELIYNPNFYRFVQEVNMLEKPVSIKRVSKSKKADYIGEEYEGSGTYFDTGLLTIRDIKPNEIINLQFKKTYNLR